MTGDDLIYVFSDFQTALRGSWEEGYMVEAKRVKIKAYRSLLTIERDKSSKLNMTIQVSQRHFRNSNHKT